MPLSEAMLELLKTAFRPHAPIEDLTSFTGRERERERVNDAISEAGLQVVIFGERGAGKTSLANVCTVGRSRVRVFCEERTTFNSLCKDITLQYRSIAPPSFKYDGSRNIVEIQGAVLPLDDQAMRSLRPPFENARVRFRQQARPSGSFSRRLADWRGPAGLDKQCPCRRDQVPLRSRSPAPKPMPNRTPTPRPSAPHPGPAQTRLWPPRRLKNPA